MEYSDFWKFFENFVKTLQKLCICQSSSKLCRNSLLQSVKFLWKFCSLVILRKILWILWILRAFSPALFVKVFVTLSLKSTYLQSSQRKLEKLARKDITALFSPLTRVSNCCNFGHFLGFLTLHPWTLVEKRAGEKALNC